MLEKIHKIIGIISAIGEIIVFLILSDALGEPILILAGFFAAFITILGTITICKILSLLESIHSQTYMINYTLKEIPNKHIVKETDDTYYNMSSENNVDNTKHSTHKPKETWICTACGTGNYQNALYCRNCGTYK